MGVRWWVLGDGWWGMVVRICSESSGGARGVLSWPIGAIRWLQESHSPLRTCGDKPPARTG